MLAFDAVATILARLGDVDEVVRLSAFHSIWELAKYGLFLVRGLGHVFIERQVTYAPRCWNPISSRLSLPASQIIVGLFGRLPLIWSVNLHNMVRFQAIDSYVFTKGQVSYASTCCTPISSGSFSSASQITAGLFGRLPLIWSVNLHNMVRFQVVDR